jgi:hypothetical protein
MEIERDLGLDLSWVEYFRLRTEVTRIINRFVRQDGNERIRMSIDEVVTGRRKGSRRYRNIMSGKWSREYIENNPRDIAAGITLWGDNMGGMSRTLVERNYELWTFSHLPYDYKNFLFKMVHGKLYLNNQRAWFMEVEPMCTFCMIREKENMKREGVLELTPPCDTHFCESTL